MYSDRCRITIIVKTSNIIGKCCGLYKELDFLKKVFGKNQKFEGELFKTLSNRRGSMKKVIVFDLLCSQPQGKIKFHGGGEYTKTVFRYCVEQNNGNYTVIACYNCNAYLDDYLIDCIKKYKVNVVNVSEIKDIVTYLNKINEDYDEIRFYVGIVNAYKNIRFPKNVVSIGTCHGLRLIEKPYDKYQLLYYKITDNSVIGNIKNFVGFIFRSYAMNRYRNIYSASIGSFDIIVTVSNHSKYSIENNFPEIYNSRKIHVFYSFTKENSIIDENYPVTNQHYIMLVSANRWIKNSYRAVISIDDLYSKGLLKGIKTRIYGNMPKKLRNRIRNINEFVFFDYVSIDELEKAYANCEILFYPTLNEGFGFVPAEAMKYGKTCVISNVCSLPEVYRDSVYYCNPYDTMEMGTRLLMAIENKIPEKKVLEHVELLKERRKQELNSMMYIIMGL